MVSRFPLILALAVLLLAPAFVHAQDAKSPDLAKQLATLLDSKKLDAFAAADKDKPGTYIATLYFPGTQLLVVSAKYHHPPALNDLIGKKDYRGVYIELSAAAQPGSKVFVMDTYADGLISKPGDSQAADSVENGSSQATFDGAWKKAKMSEQDYMKAFGDADSAYVHILEILINQLKTSGT